MFSSLSSNNTHRLVYVHWNYCVIVSIIHPRVTVKFNDIYSKISLRSEAATYEINICQFSSNLPLSVSLRWRDNNTKSLSKLDGWSLVLFLDQLWDALLYWRSLQIVSSIPSIHGQRDNCLWLFRNSRGEIIVHSTFYHGCLYSCDSVRVHVLSLKYALLINNTTDINKSSRGLRTAL